MGNKFTARMRRVLEVHQDTVRRASVDAEVASAEAAALAQEIKLFESVAAEMIARVAAGTYRTSTVEDLLLKAGWTGRRERAG